MRTEHFFNDLYESFWLNKYLAIFSIFLPNSSINPIKCLLITYFVASRCPGHRGHYSHALPYMGKTDNKQERDILWPVLWSWWTRWARWGGWEEWTREGPSSRWHLNWDLEHEINQSLRVLEEEFSRQKESKNTDKSSRERTWHIGRWPKLSALKWITRGVWLQRNGRACGPWEGVWILFSQQWSTHDRFEAD